MDIEEIRKFLRERGLEAVPASGGPSGNLSDFISWSPENTESLQFLGGSFPDGVNAIFLYNATCNTLRISSGFPLLNSVNLTGCAITTLSLPDSVASLTLDGATPAVPLNCTFPAGLRILSLESALYTAIPDLPAGLETLDISNCALGVVPEFPASLITLICDGIALPSIPPLAGTQLQTLQAIGTALTALPALPATLTTLYINGTPGIEVPTIPTGVIDINAADCSWDSDKVDNLLAQLVANNQHNGHLTVDGGDDAPGPAGITDRDTLTSRGWMVSTN